MYVFPRISHCLSLNTRVICNRFDYTTPIEETMQALHDVVKAGYVRYIGMSSCYAYQCSIPLTFPAVVYVLMSPDQSTRCRVRVHISYNLTT